MEQSRYALFHVIEMECGMRDEFLGKFSAARTHVQALGTAIQGAQGGLAGVMLVDAFENNG